jgi:integrase
VATKRQPKRANGEGSVYKEGNGWVGRLYIDGHRRKVRARTKTDALAAMHNLRLDAASGVSVDGRLTVGKVLELWSERTLANRELSPASRDGYRHALDTLRREFGRDRLRTLSVERVERGLDNIATGVYGRGRPLSRRTVKYVRSTLAQALDVAVKRRWIDYNPARLAEFTPTAPPTGPRRALTPAEAETLWSALEGERLGNYFRLLLLTGVRPGEGLGLLWSAVDLEAGVMHVWRAVRRDGGRAELVDYVKTVKSYRTIALPAPAVDVLRDQRKVVAELRLAARVWAKDDRDLVFPTATGAPWDPSNARDELTRIAADAGLWRVRPYELRHSAATILNDRGVRLEEIADLLGHVDTTMVSRVYRHRVRPAADAAVAVFDDMFGNTRGR